MTRRPLPDSEKRQEQKRQRLDSRVGISVGIIFLVAAVVFFLLYMLG